VTREEKKTKSAFIWGESLCIQRREARGLREKRGPLARKATSQGRRPKKKKPGVRKRKLGNPKNAARGHERKPFRRTSKKLISK